jgi:hypothetical protein
MAVDERRNITKAEMMRRTIAVLAMVVLAACSRDAEGKAPDDTDALADTPASTTSVHPTTTVASPEQEVLAAYRGYWDTWLAANDPPDPDHPHLSRFFTGTALERARTSIATNRTLGHAVRLPAGSRYAHHASVVELVGDTATVSDCAVDDSQLVVASDGSVLNDQVVTSKASAQLQRHDSVWRVVDVTVIQRWEGVVICVV